MTTRQLSIPQHQDLEFIKTEIERGVADLAEGRVHDFETTRIIERGGKLLDARQVTPVVELRS